ncbi:class I SAM-dependent methyltransferase [Amycolatopsis sp. cmx-11-12]|uniref:class I SAM-dependent methyltransferase n=1 Tax=Amycolatopsis sp. cmx-11-12 TaxID=2785795 RepID=UPI00391850F1
MPATPFTDPDLIAGQLYADADRIQQRTNALHTAKIAGDDATATLVELAAHSAPPSPVVCDIGCGRGSTTLQLAQRLAPARLIALDQSAALLNTVRGRFDAAGRTVETCCADFHHLPQLDASIDVAVAAFCLYHSPQPASVIGQVGRCLTPGGRAVLATKSANSYREIDQLIAESGLDIHAATRPSLYTSFHSENAAEITATALCVEQVVHHEHVFRFSGLDHLAVYVATSPKYELPDGLVAQPGRLAAELHRRLDDHPVVTTSTVTYVSAVRP